ncbi:Gfo/Idh/MocA family protein [Opitutus terrae]|uniref:Oxidoreductase domain protein n=1 Tax=Opitutus terrae (strain DSM 11246 / JCM 15787 / PB90-1) TaxID=452637 RepID=B1ZZI0_OPITP|nr:Gfo/Idh/MocA family oxidoreductase [Opitutus terrae]ACB76383.1 oxidoreductase domain protein [Opitutus terrae PB90-1]
MSRPVSVGLIGCGKISDAYFSGTQAYSMLKIVACADLDQARAEAKAREHGVRACSVEQLLRDPQIELVINLTIPVAHAEVNTAALQAGKHVYAEKPFALDSTAGASVLALARERALLVGCAPDTFLGGGLQTARKAIDDGAIGRPVSAMAFMLSRGHETWHPSPQFYYQKGGGPMFDMGPYYLTALINFLGPVARVCGSTQSAFTERLITSQPLAGTKIPVETPTHVAGVLEFVNGGSATIVTSFDTWPYPLPRLLVFGTEGTLEAPDPNRFDGAVRIRDAKSDEFREFAPTHTVERGRGSGAADMACSILRRERSHRASGALAQHVLEIMEAFEKSSRTGRHVKIKSRCERPAALPVGLAPNELDE